MTDSPPSNRTVRPSRSRYRPLIALGILPLLWGFTWVPLKIGVEYCPPFTFAALRSLPGAILLLGLTAVLRRPVGLKAPRYTIPLGVLQTSGFIGLTIAALVAGGAGRTAILANTWQFWILLMAWPILDERLHGLQWLSVSLALAGLILIVQPWNLHGIVSSLLALAGAVCWAAGSIVAKLLRRRHQVDLLALTAWQTLFGSILLVVVAVFVEGESPEWSSAFIWSLLYALLIGHLPRVVPLAVRAARDAGQHRRSGDHGDARHRPAVLLGPAGRAAYRPRDRGDGRHPCRLGDPLCPGRAR